MSRSLRIRRAIDRSARRSTHYVDPTMPEAAHLADVLSHRLRGLVAGILGYSDLLLEHLGPPDQRDLTMRIMESAQRIEHVIADMKHFTRPTEPHVEDLAVVDLLADLVKRLPDDMAEQIRLDVDAGSEAIVVADRYLARDILLLLIQNAAEATRTRGSIDLRIGREDDQVTFDVTNAGVIDVEARDRMFEPFFTTKARNLGVGLPLARRLARAQQGDVGLAPSQQSGHVTFRLHLPAAMG